MSVRIRVCDRNRELALRNIRLKLMDDVPGRKNLSADRYSGILCEFFGRTALWGAANFIVNFFPNELPKANFLCYDQNVVGWLGEQPLAHALRKGLQWMPHRLRSLNAFINQVVEIGG